MQNLLAVYERVDVDITKWMARYGVVLLRIALGIIFFWFGFLKFFPGMSPAEDLAVRTISKLSFDLIPENVSILVLATWECLIGLGLLSGKFLRATLLLLLLQMIGAASPILIFPQEVFTAIPYAPTLEGQYIRKNLVLVSAGLVIGATVRGGRVVADPT